MESNEVDLRVILHIQIILESCCSTQLHIYFEQIIIQLPQTPRDLPRKISVWVRDHRAAKYSLETHSFRLASWKAFCIFSDSCKTPFQFSHISQAIDHIFWIRAVSHLQPDMRELIKFFVVLPIQRRASLLM